MAQVVEVRIDIIDRLDGDADLEDDGGTERETGQHVVPTGLVLETCADRAA